jgi:hypothetical protein
MPYYELHITVAENDQLESFEERCKGFLCKANLIELNQGQYPLQLMLAKKGILNTDAEALEWGEIMSGFVGVTKFTPIRVKVEAPLGGGQVTYFEAHWKFDLGSPREGRPKVSRDNMERSIEEFTASFPGFLRSRNVGRPSVYYLSQRAYHNDFDEAMVQFDSAHTQIVKYLDFAVPLGGVHYERVLFDSDPSLDAGWGVQCS